MENQEHIVIVVGAGPSGLAMAASLTKLSIPYVLIEREDCFASLWQKKSYDRLHLHLAKQFCELPHMSFPSNCPKYVPKNQFLQYLHDYVSHFKITPLYQRSVESAFYDQDNQKWIVRVKNMENSADVEEYSGRFLVVATGETSDPFIPDFDGLSSFKGDVIHSTEYKCGESFSDKHVLVVGSGNSGMEIALDLCEYDAKTSIAVRSPVHVLSRGMVYMGLILLKHIPLCVVDYMMIILSKIRFGDLTKYGIQTPIEGPFASKVKYGKYPVIDAGTCKKIKNREIQVLPAIRSIKGNDVEFEDGKTHTFHTIVFATGFSRSTSNWLHDDDYLINEEGLPKPEYPNHWKGKNGLFCVGLARRGLYGAAMDALNIANYINTLQNPRETNSGPK